MFGAWNTPEFSPCPARSPSHGPRRATSAAPREAQQAAKVTEACRMIETAETPPKLDELAMSAGMSPYHFHRVFKAATGVTPKAYAVAHRRKRVGEALKGDKSVTEAIYEAGFNS